MRKLITILILLTFTTGIKAQEIDAKALVKRSNDLILGVSSFSKMTMTIQRPEWSRKVSMQSWSHGTEFYMIYIVLHVFI